MINVNHSTVLNHALIKMILYFLLMSLWLYQLLNKGKRKICFSLVYLCLLFLFCLSIKGGQVSDHFILQKIRYNVSNLRHFCVLCKDWFASMFCYLFFFTVHCGLDLKIATRIWALE